MQFLEENKIVHGDLATRNILLHKEKSIAKVADFGLSRSLYASVEDLATVSSGLPVRSYDHHVFERVDVLIHRLLIYCFYLFL